MESVIAKSDEMLAKAERVLIESGVRQAWLDAGCRVNIVGAMAMGLMATHRDVDMHVYSKGVTLQWSSSVVARIVESADVFDVVCEDGLDSDEHCVSWHFKYRSKDGEIWSFDIIHIEAGSEYDGLFEQMALSVREMLTDDVRALILNLKFSTPSEVSICGVEYYEAVLECGVDNINDLLEWVALRRRNPRTDYWMPKGVE